MNFIKKLAIFSLAIGIVVFVLSLFVSVLYYKDVLMLWAIFTLITGASYYVVHQSLHKNPKKFPIAFLGSAMAKLAILLITVIVFLFSTPERTKGFLLTMGIFYLAYAVFEMIMELQLIRKKKQEEKRE